MDAEGVEAFSVRGLARRLGVESSALYWHFSTKDEIFRAVLALVDDPPEPSVSDQPPRVALAHHLEVLRNHWLAHPVALELMRLVPPALDTFGPAVPRLLQEIGVPEEQVVERYRALVWVVLGFVHVERNISRSANYRLIEDGTRRYEVLRDEPHLTPAPLDTDDLFEHIVTLLLDATAAEASDRRRDDRRR